MFRTSANYYGPCLLEEVINYSQESSDLIVILFIASKFILFQCYLFSFQWWGMGVTPSALV